MKEAIREQYKNATPDIQGDANLLYRVAQLTPEDPAPSWKERIVRIRHVGYYRIQKFVPENITQTLSPEEKERLITKTKARLWERMAKDGFQDLAIFAMENGHKKRDERVNNATKR